MKEGLLGEHTLLVITKAQAEEAAHVVRGIGSQPQTPRL
jgi:hypothetical protein